MLKRVEDYIFAEIEEAQFYVLVIPPGKSDVLDANKTLNAIS